jgi:uncharacterized protein (DUF433 family)
MSRIEITAGVCGGKPRIAGHRIRVMDIVVCHEQQKMSPKEIASFYLSVSLADVEAALAYYFEHRDEIQLDLEKERLFAEEIRRNTPSRLNYPEPNQ